ncbi:MAG: hypothetical protein ACKOI0_05140, partial [Actinomycetota bacterium]
MNRRFAAALVAVGVPTVLLAAPAWAHGLGGRVDLPVPRWLFVFGAATVLVVSFALLGALWRAAPVPRPAPQGPARALQTVRRSRAGGWGVRAIGLAWVHGGTLAGLHP